MSNIRSSDVHNVDEYSHILQNINPLQELKVERWSGTKPSETPLPIESFILELFQIQNLNRDQTERINDEWSLLCTAHSNHR